MYPEDGLIVYGSSSNGTNPNQSFSLNQPAIGRSPNNPSALIGSLPGD